MPSCAFCYFSTESLFPLRLSRDLPTCRVCIECLNGLTDLYAKRLAENMNKGRVDRSIPVPG